MGDGKKQALRVSFDRGLRLEFHGANITSDAGLPDHRRPRTDATFVDCWRIRQAHHASVSVLQRRLRIGYTRASHMMDVLEERGIVGPDRGAEPREILNVNEELIEQCIDGFRSVLQRLLRTGSK